MTDEQQQAAQERRRMILADLDAIIEDYKMPDDEAASILIPHGIDIAKRGGAGKAAIVEATIQVCNGLDAPVFGTMKVDSIQIKGDTRVQVGGESIRWAIFDGVWQALVAASVLIIVLSGMGGVADGLGIGGLWLKIPTAVAAWAAFRWYRRRSKD